MKIPVKELQKLQEKTEAIPMGYLPIPVHSTNATMD